MKIKFAPILLAVGFAGMAVPVQAESLIDGNLDAGKATGVVCTACHGPEGNSVSPLWPNIAGQNANYLVAQLKAFQKGTRNDPLMTPQAMLLTEQDMKDVAVFFESLPAAAQAVADPGLIPRAEALYRGGNNEEGTAACLACHGPTGRGNPAASYPALNGQHAAYVAKQLQDYAADSRTSDDPTHTMRDIAKRLSKEDIQALASYVQGLK